MGNKQVDREVHMPQRMTVLKQNVLGFLVKVSEVKQKV